jgi:leader peptidase (prepilin peptidase)/N-methyltransferase
LIEVIVCAAFGLVVGSFLNVVIHRLPVMMEREWRAQCAELEGRPAPAAERYDLLTPRSRCPKCDAPIRALDNVPVVSWLALGGRCRHCRASISARYPLVEIAASGLGALAAAQFDGWQLASALVFSWALLAAAVIDLDHQLLPDDITLPLLWLGLLLAVGGVFTSPAAAIVGAAAGYGSLWLVFQVFRLVTGKDGMGYGDFKLTAALGAWLGWKMLPLVIFGASLVGAAVGLAMLAVGRHQRGKPLPFGPFLAAGGVVAFYWGPALTGAWLGLLRV